MERNSASLDLEEMSKELSTDVCTLELIINAFKQKSNHDSIITFCRPVYSLTVQAVEELREGMTLTGNSLIFIFYFIIDRNHTFL